LCRIEKYLRRQESLQTKLGPANFGLRAGAIEPFAKLLEEFMRHRALRSLFTTNEATLQGVVEMLLDPPRTRVSGELPITLTRPDRSLIQRQKTPVSTFGLKFYRPMLERFYRQGGPYPPVYSIFLFTNDRADF
jgi:hypothetical protein